jgi:glutaredoxin
MKTLFTLFTFLLITINSFAQNDHEFVKLSEEKKGKRLKLYATNTDSISYDVFLRVVTKDYRRSSNRPTILNVPPNSKVELITLIQLVGSEGQYDSTFIVNEVAPALEIDKNYNELDKRLNNAIENQKVVLFTSNDCNICTDAKRVLGESKIGFTEYNIDEDASKYLKAVEEFQTDKNPIKTTLPLLKVNERFYKNINSLEGFNTILRKEFK